MVTEDVTLSAGIELDRDALQQVQEQELGITGGDGAAEDFKEMDEERNEILQVMTRGIGRIAGRLGKIGAIIAILGVIAKILGSVFDISFSDVRDAVAEALSGTIDGIKNALGLGGGSGFRQANATERAMTPGPLGFASLSPKFFNLPGSDSGSSAPSKPGEFFRAQLFTSRDQLSGDSTQKEQSSGNMNFFDIEGGS